MGHRQLDIRLVLALPGVLLCMSAGCYSASELRAQDEVVSHDLEQARHDGAYRCAPRELATAEANLDFADNELGDGHPTEAHAFSLVAQDNTKKALELSKGCGPKEVVIQEPVVVKDTDGDGVPDDIDRCPTEPGPKDNFGCPWGDRDKDGIPDNVDKCPDVPGIPELQGCPDVDTDKDGIPDRLDKCPTVPGIPELQGCPDKDSDGDGIPDRQDKCPDVPGVPPDGCPKKYSLVVVHKDRIEIRQQVHFATNKSKILSDSFTLLGQVVSVLQDSPKLRIKVEGHTDNVGSPSHNLKLSQERADSVMEFLIEHGVDAARLTAEGFGPNRPIASNSTKAGKAQNRRVEFRIAAQEPPPVDGAVPAPAPDAAPAP